MTWSIREGDVLDRLREMPDESVQCCVTSPPYWGLRDYGVDGQIGLEASPEEHIAKLVEVFREVRRVLRSDGVLWLNYGDAYFGGGRGGNPEDSDFRKQATNAGSLVKAPRWGSVKGDLKPKDLIGLPWMLAFALRADGWCLRSDIIWAKANPMPESVQDRPTRSHEYLFMFCKAEWSGAQPRQFALISEEDARWLALFLDTEGNICVKRAALAGGKTTYGVQIAFAGTCRPLLLRAQEIIGKGTILERRGKNAPMFYLQLSNMQAADLLHRIYPHLIVKQRQARLGIYLQDVLADSEHDRRSKEGRLRGRGRSDSYTALLERLWATNKSLNHFGDPDIEWISEPSIGRWSRAARYYYDAEAIREEAEYGRRSAFRGGAYVNQPRGQNNGRANAESPSVTGSDPSSGRNARTVWTINPQPTPEAHFATFPEALAERCIKAGSRPGDTVLDPFAGSGTTLLVAERLGRDSLGIELNPEYIAIAERRIKAHDPTATIELAPGVKQASLFTGDMP